MKRMEQLNSLNELTAKIAEKEKLFLLLYKEGSEISKCALDHFQDAFNGVQKIRAYTTDVSKVRDIHSTFGISSAPSLLVFENGALTNVIKGCQEIFHYKALAENTYFQSDTGITGTTIKTVTVYSTPTCSWCNTLKNWLRKNNIPFKDVDISKDNHAAENIVRRSGQQGVPQTDINGTIVVGFNQSRLKELLEIQ